MKIAGENLRVGDTLKLMWRSNATIKCFHEYAGPLDFVCKVAEFYDGAKMSISAGRYYEVVK